MQVNIDHKHAAVIAAFYSGKRIRVYGDASWMEHGVHSPLFNAYRYEIEPEVVVKYGLLYPYGGSTVPAVEQFRTIAEADQEKQDFQFVDKYIKYEYTDGVLTNVSLVSE